MNPFEQLLVESKLIELSLERAQNQLVMQASAARPAGVRACAGGLLVRLGLWLDPGAEAPEYRTSPQA